MSGREARVWLPGSLDELWKIWSDAPDAVLYAGGTDLMVRRRKGGPLAGSDLICLERVADFREIREEGEEILIGAGCTIASLMDHPLVRQNFPVLTQAFKVLGSPPIRNMASIGGNICTASPAGDTLPPLYVMDALLELRRENGLRRIPIREFITGPGKTDLGPGEVLSVIRIPRLPRYNLHHYEKVGQRNALSISIAGLAAIARISAERTIEDIRLAWGSVGPTVVRSRNIEKALTGKPLSSESMEAVFPMVDRAVSPIDDLRASACYRRMLARNLLLRLLFMGDHR